TMNNGQGYGGRRDWRLPTVHELETLVDFGARITFSLAAPEPGTEAPAIHGYAQGSAPFVREGPFPDTPINKGFWTATGIAVLFNGQFSRSNAYVVEFKKGHVGNAGPLLNTSRATTNRHKVRCVAGPIVEPPPQTLNPSTVQAGAALGGNAAAFIGFDGNANFNDTFFYVTGAAAAYDVQNDTHTVTVNFNRLADPTQAGLTANYCIAAANATTCTASSPPIASALPGSGNSYVLTLSSAMGANTAYKLFISNIESASDIWTSGKSYSTGRYLLHSGSCYRVLTNHTATTLAADIAASRIELLSNWAAATAYPQNTKLYVPSLGVVVNVQNTGYTSSSNVQNDINSGQLLVVKSNFITVPHLPLSLGRALFNGPVRANAPAPSVVFNITGASASNLSTVNVTFNRLPNAAEAANPANYCIISATANPWNCSAPVATISSVAYSGYTATLTLASPLTAGTGYAVLVNGVTYRGSNIVDDPINKLRWQRCRKGVFDTPDCADDGISGNDTDYWNDALNYCDRLNHERYDGYAYPDSGVSSLLDDRYRWRAPTINELKSISNRALFGVAGVSIDTAIFPTPNPLAEDFHSSTSYALSGPNSGSNTPYYDRAWSFSFVTGFTGISQRDHSELTSSILKPPKKSIRCVRSLP
ncbi:MAG: DUF1566 domain-containing protein, partial [Turneriella sp.]|nr:DUF1566 domain-containing protein [Turneriella sp.]